jgi:hypothetical protein
MEPTDYEEIGRTMAGAVLEGGKSMGWALEMVKPLGYKAADLEEWLVAYRRENYEALRWQRNKAQRRREKIDRLEAQAGQLLKSLSEDRKT